jgi:nucleoside-diphosphate-sugar epimerase
MKRAMVTGASGFIGANLARRLLADGHEVHLLVSPNGELWRLKGLRGDTQTHPIDLSDADAVNRTVAAIQPDWIFHLAAHGAYSWQSDVRRMIATNLVGTINLVEAAMRGRFESLVNTGSSSEYGFKDHAPSEDEFVDPNSHYAITKLSATHYCRYIAQSRSMRIMTLRLYSVYGPWEDPNRLIPTLIVRGLHNELPRLVDPTVARDYVYIDDVLDAYILAAQHLGPELGSVLNVGSGIQTSVQQAVELACKELGISQQPMWGSMPNRIWDSNVWLADTRKIKSVLGWSPRHSLRDGFRATVEWFRRHPDIEQWYRDSSRHGDTA